MSLYDADKPVGMSVKSFADKLGIGMTCARALVMAGKVKSIKVGDRRIVLHSELERIVAEGGIS
jgi:hypothetical protein